MKNYFALTIILSFLFSCSNETDIFDSQGFLSRSYTNETKPVCIISMEEAQVLSDNAMCNFFNNTKQRSNKRHSSVSLYYPPTKSRSIQNDTTFYIVNYDEGGYVFLAADKYIKHKVYIISENGTFNPDNLNPVQQFYLDLACESLSYAERDSVNPDDIITFALDTTGMYMGDRREIAPGVWVYGKSKTTKEEISPLLKTKWGQYEPFNNYCPNKCPAGCVAIAIGQICAYHKKPMAFRNFYIQWDEILKDPYAIDISEVTKSNLAIFIKNVGDAVNMSYHPDSSGTTIDNALKGIVELGFKSDGIQDFSYTRVKKSIAADCPVEMFGICPENNVGHSWVADGYKYFSVKTDYYREDNNQYCFSESYGNKFLFFNMGNYTIFDKYFPSEITYYSFDFYTETPDSNLEYTNQIKTICNIK